ncbi:MAG: tetratricopeptide (TPR) repeat protein [Cognaticolwellia sp.]
MLMEARARNSADLQAFRSEVRAAARLIHPAIASVLDYGEVGPEDAKEDLPLGSPWLAMELGQGTLHARCGHLDWPAMLAVLEQLLGALAHAHAHGLVHRDVKPRNLLQVDGAWKLSDFGLAHVLSEQDDSRIIGTPRYMAPEHFAGAWRDHGPWTDLYSLGCLTWHMVCGTPPFSAARTPATLREAHQTWPVPALIPAHPVPAGLEGWVRRLMAKAPSDRPQLAADALFALRALGPAATPRSTPAMLGPADQEMATAELDLSVPLPLPVPQALEPWPHPPFSPDWRDDPRLPPPAGLGLLALRARPVVGRRDERDLLWQALGEVIQEGQMKVVALSGPVGVGATHLANWLATESHARGQATCFRSHWSRGRGPSEGFAPTVERAYALHKLDRSGQRIRLSRLLRSEKIERPEQESQILLSVLHPTPPTRAARFAAEEQRAALRRLAMRRAQDRALVWVMDDPEHGPEALELLRLLRADPKLKLFVVVPTKSPERLAGLVDLHIALAPLPESDLDELLRSVLGLAPELALQVQARCQGNPAFAQQLVEAWVDENALENTPQGLKLASAEDLPESLASTWARRLERLLGNRPASDGKALELAALSGRSVDLGEWLAVCEKTSCVPTPGLLEALLRRDLARIQNGQWRFAHAWLREALVQRAQAHGHWPILHALLAASLSGAGPGRAGERGAHHLEAGSWPQALSDLSTGQAWLLDRGALAQAALLEPLRTRALRAQNPPMDDPARGQDLLLRARLAFGRGEALEGHKLAKQAVQAARRQGWTLLEAQALLEGGRLLHRRGELSRAKRWLRRAVKASLSSGNRPLAGHCRELLASTLSELGEGELAALTLQAAWEDYASCGDGVGVGSVHLGMSFLAMASEGLDDAEAHARVALEHCTGVGAERMRCAAMTVLGDVCRASGDTEQAQKWFTRTLRLHRSSGRLYAVAVTQLNLALTAIEANNLQQAQGALSEVARFQQGQGAGNLLALTWLAQAVCAARNQDPGAATYLDQATLRLNRTGQVHRDIRVLAEHLGTACTHAGWTELALRANGLAQHQSQALESA